MGATQRNPVPVQDANMHILLPCLRESAVIFYPVQDWTKHSIQNMRTGPFAFEAPRHTKSAKIIHTCTHTHTLEPSIVSKT